MAGKNPIKFTDTTFQGRSPVAVGHPHAVRGHHSLHGAHGPDGLLCHRGLGGRHLRHHPPFSGGRPLGADPHHQGDPEEDPHHDAAPGPEPGGIPELRRRSHLPVRALRRRGRGGHLPGLRCAKRHAQLGSGGQGPDGRQEGGPHGPLPGGGVLLADPAAHGRAHLQPGLLRQFCQEVRGHGGRLGGLEGHGRDVLAQRRLRHHQGDEGDHQDPGGVPHPLHLGLRLHELPEGHRSRAWTCWTPA